MEVPKIDFKIEPVAESEQNKSIIPLASGNTWEYSVEFYEFVKKKFIKTKLTKPKASRKPSSELYCICMGFINSEKSQ